MVTRSVFAALFLAVFGFSSFASAKNYYVEPMICKGQWNKNPPGYHPSYKWAGMKVTSFWSVRARDCSKAASSATEVNYGATEAEVKFTEEGIMGWYDQALTMEDGVVQAPNGVLPGEMELKITSTRIERDGKRTDTLEGRYKLFKDYHYDLTCTANVVANPSHVENNTKNCP